MGSSSNEIINKIFKKAADMLGGFKGVSIVELDSGLSQGSLCVDSSFDLDAASAYNADVVKAKIKAKEAMGLDEELELIIFELSSQIHLIRPIHHEKLLIYLAVDSNDNIGIVRSVMKKMVLEIESELIN